MAAHKTGRIFVISAPSGSGKTTLCKRLLSACPSLVFSISMTTRRPRKGERENRDYRFVSEKTFKGHIRKNRLLEWARVFDNYYGTPAGFVKDKIRKGKDVLLAIDVQGALKVKKKMSEAILIFILPPSMKELKRRLYRRKTESAAQMKLRLKIAKAEMAQGKKYDYLVVNDRIDKAVRKLAAITQA